MVDQIIKSRSGGLKVTFLRRHARYVTFWEKAWSQPTTTDSTDYPLRNGGENLRWERSWRRPIPRNPANIPRKRR